MAPVGSQNIVFSSQTRGRTGKPEGPGAKPTEGVGSPIAGRYQATSWRARGCGVCFDGPDTLYLRMGLADTVYSFQYMGMAGLTRSTKMQGRLQMSLESEAFGLLENAHWASSHTSLQIIRWTMYPNRTFCSLWAVMPNSIDRMFIMTPQGSYEAHTQTIHVYDDMLHTFGWFGWRPCKQKVQSHGVFGTGVQTGSSGRHRLKRSLRSHVFIEPLGFLRLPM